MTDRLGSTTHISHGASRLKYDFQFSKKKLSHMLKEIQLIYCIRVKSTMAELEGYYLSFTALQHSSCSSTRHQSIFEHLSNGQIVPKPELEYLLPWSLGRPVSPRRKSPMHSFHLKKSSQCYSSSLSSSLNSSSVRRKCSSVLWHPM